MKTNKKMNECVTKLKLNVEGIIYGGDITGHSFVNDKCERCGIIVDGIGASLHSQLSDNPIPMTPENDWRKEFAKKVMHGDFARSGMVAHVNFDAIMDCFESYLSLAREEGAREACSYIEDKLRPDIQFGYSDYVFGGVLKEALTAYKK